MNRFDYYFLGNTENHLWLRHKTNGTGDNVCFSLLFSEISRDRTHSDDVWIHKFHWIATGNSRWMFLLKITQNMNWWVSQRAHMVGELLVEIHCPENLVLIGQQFLQSNCITKYVSFDEREHLALMMINGAINACDCLFVYRCHATFAKKFSSFGSTVQTSPPSLLFSFFFAMQFNIRLHSPHPTHLYCTVPASYSNTMRQSITRDRIVWPLILCNEDYSRTLTVSQPISSWDNVDFMGAEFVHSAAPNDKIELTNRLTLVLWIIQPKPMGDKYLSISPSVGAPGNRSISKQSIHSTLIPKAIINTE